MPESATVFHPVMSEYLLTSQQVTASPQARARAWRHALVCWGIALETMLSAVRTKARQRAMRAAIWLEWSMQEAADARAIADIGRMAFLPFAFIVTRRLQPSATMMKGSEAPHMEKSVRTRHVSSMVDPRAKQAARRRISKGPGS